MTKSVSVSPVAFQMLTFAMAGGTFAAANSDPSLLPPVYDPADVTGSRCARRPGSGRAWIRLRNPGPS